jgi:hypothetical protein
MNLLSLPPEILQALRMDGEITPDLEICDVPPTWQSRSQSVLQDFGPNVVLTGESAMWALGAAMRPNVFTASCTSSRRKRRVSSAFICWEERRFVRSEVFLERGVGITTPLRTICDVLRFPHFADRNIRELKTLISMNRIEVVDIQVALSEKRKVPYKEVALSRLDLLAL